MTVPVSEVRATITVHEIEQRSLLSTGNQQGEHYRAWAKRVTDVVLVLLASIVALPLVAAIAAFIWIRGGKPFYTQDRVGRGGRTFKLYKLRTMVANADEVLAELLASDPEARREWETTQKLKDDPRITAFGRFLRKSSLDELPQLLNILRGEMSVVGPRPMMVGQMSMYPGQAYYRLRPGLTGFWQISDRNACDFADRAAFDEAYDRSVSPATDARVIFRTVGVVLRGTGY